MDTEIGYFCSQMAAVYKTIKSIYFKRGSWAKASDILEKKSDKMDVIPLMVSQNIHGFSVFRT